MRALLLTLLMVGCGGASVRVGPEPADESVDEPPPPPRVALALRVEDVGGVDPETEAPRARISLVRIDAEGGMERVTLGEEAAICHPADRPGALLTVRCWWAGAGAVYTVVRQGDEAVARRAEEREERALGAAEEVGRLSLPEGADLRLVR